MLTLKQYQNELENCEKDPAKFFGASPDSKLREISLAIHPDKFLDSKEIELAKSLFQKFSYFHSILASLTDIGPYRVVRKLNTGDLCEVFHVRKGPEEYILKRPRVSGPSVNKILEKEFLTCQALSEGGAIHRMMVPKPVELSSVGPVYEFRDNLITGQGVIAKYGDNLDSRHVVWMFKRMLMVMGYAHLNGYVHGAVTPDHLLFSKPDHGLILCGWIHSGKIGDAITVVPAKWKHYYPDDVKKTKKLEPSLDIYMAAKSMLDIAGGNLHKRIDLFLKSCLLPGRMRPSDAWKLHDEMKEVGKNIFGKSKFVEL